MTEDEHISYRGERPLVQWLPTGRTRERAMALGVFTVGLLVGALLVGGALYGRERFFHDDD